MAFMTLNIILSVSLKFVNHERPGEGYLYRSAWHHYTSIYVQNYMICHFERSEKSLFFLFKDFSVISFLRNDMVNYAI